MPAHADEPSPTPLAGLTGDVTIVPLSLAAGAVDLAALEQLLGPGERDRAARSAPEVRRRFVAARGGLRRLLARVLDDDPAALEFAVGPRGKPTLGARHAGRCHFNLTHSQDLCLVALSSQLPLGIDLEVATPARGHEWAATLARTILTDTELAAHGRVSEEARPAALLEAWVAKEAVLKAAGEGIAAGVRHLELPASLPRAALAAGEPPGRVELAVVPPGPWRVCLLDTAAGGFAALACTAESCLISLVPPTRFGL